MKNPKQLLEMLNTDKGTVQLILENPEFCIATTLASIHETLEWIARDLDTISTELITINREGIYVNRV